MTTTTSTTSRTERLHRVITAAAARLHAIDAATVTRAGINLAAYSDGHLTMPEAAGVFSVNVEELLEIIERLARP
jgi:hypothetical protein